MSTKRQLRLRQPTLVPEHLAFFRYGEVAGKVLLTNDSGQWHFLSKEDFETLLAGKLEAEHPEHAALSEKGFLREGFDVDSFAAKLRQKKRFVGVGPHLHIVITTLRCNQSCRYCHASRAPMDRTDTDMSLDTAKQVVDLAMRSTSPIIDFEFQGGEPTLNMPVIEFILDYSREKNREEGKTLVYSLVTNLTRMTEQTADWLLDNQVQVCTSLDGPELLHDRNRPWKKGSSSFDAVMKWMEYFRQGYEKRGLDSRIWHVDALMTTTRQTFDHWKEVIDLYVELGLHTVQIRPLNPYGFAASTWKDIGYSAEEYLDYYARSLDYLLELNQQGVEIVEGTAAVFLNKILTDDDPNYVDIRSPCGAGTGQVAYNHDGRIFPCDEARMVDAQGDPMFQIGETGGTEYVEMLQHPTIRAMAIASLQDSLPGCATCWNLPFCGVCPLHNYQVEGDLFGQRPRSSKCKEYYAIATLLFERLADDPDGAYERILRRWTLSRPRHQGPSCEV